MKNKWTLLLILVIGIAACAPQAADPSDAEAFELYLLADEQIRGLQLADIPLADLVLAETPLLTTADIVTYDRGTHTIELTDAGYEKVTALLAEGLQVAGIPFAILAKGERIYAGAFWSMLSSQSFDGVVIMDPVFTEDQAITVSLGYPGSGFFTGTDPRNDARLMEALDEAGVLK
jgi:hypothetical protein